MRTLWILAAALPLAACGTTDYRDTNAAVDADPLCASRPDRPGEPVSRDCERYSEGRWSSRPEPQPVDFRKRDDR
ncbi:hypothetical protein [Luteimonas sp. FCS-9]|uniref:hypothetical protein n=1 Tax=Luteimonas sp. FCS-9 TaxID=1547516 RepID=UPI00063E981B|nr:hypothetical protein [Luteimonas sp. FCS-9]KLI99916.1 hypothetical protein WQ56_11040 [Luteimonas sp. FCS-9]